MRIALSTTAALALVPVAQTASRFQERRERRLETRALSSQFLLAASAIESSIASIGRSQPLWKQRSLADATPCNISSIANSDEPDVGILGVQQCPPGYSCQLITMDGGDSDPMAAATGACVMDHRAAVQRQLQTDNYCTYYEEVLGYECDCTNWNNNVGTFDCVYKYGNATYFGIPVEPIDYIQVEISEAGAPEQVRFQMCYQVMDTSASEGLENICIVSYETFTDRTATVATNTTCAVTVNDQTCTSCTVANCNLDTVADATVTPDSFDCSNVNPDFVVDDICDGNSIWKQLFSAEFPTTEPTGYPTYAPSISIDTPSPAGTDGDATAAPNTSSGQPSPSTTTTDNNTTPTAAGGGEETPAADESAAYWSMSSSWGKLLSLSLTGSLVIGIGAAGLN